MEILRGMPAQRAWRSPRWQREILSSIEFSTSKSLASRRPKEVAAARERLGISQRKAGEILGGGPRAFQKYEAGKQALSVPMSRLLTLLANNPKRLRELPGAPKAAKRSRKSA